MFERHFGLRENPFVAGHQHRFVYPSPEHLEALAHLRYGIENREPFVLITGEVGTGKTTALYDALSEWESRVVVALITNSALSRAELLEEIALRFGVMVSPGSSKPQIMTALERHLLAVRAKQHRAMLLLDEAQNLERDVLEEIRLLSNLENAGDNLLQVVLVGQPELEEKLGRPELRQLRQRITVHYRLSPLSADDTERYIQHRVTVAGGQASTVFPSASCHAIHRLTGGIPREINHLAAQAMLTAYVDDATSVRLEHVETAAHEIEFKSVTANGESVPAAATTAPTASAPMPATTAPPPPAPAPEPAPVAPTAPAAPPAPRAPRATPSESAPRTVSSDAWDAWMAAIATTAEAAARAEAEPAPPVAPPPAAHAAYMPSRSEPEPPAQHTSEPHDFAATLAAAVHTPPPAAPAAPRAEEELSLASELPARLRERLEQDAAEEEDAAPRRSPLPWLVGAAAAAALVVSAVLWVRFHGQSAAPVATMPAASTTVTPATHPRPAAVPTPTASDSATRTTRDTTAATVASAARPPAPATPAAKPPSAPVTPSAATAATRAPAPEPGEAARAASKPAPKPAANAMTMHYGVVVHTFLAHERADAESARLAGVSGLPGRVIAVKEDGSDAFRIVLGSWGDRGAAERGASDLIRKGLVDEARVVPIGRAPAKP